MSENVFHCMYSDEVFHIAFFHIIEVSDLPSVPLEVEPVVVSPPKSSSCDLVILKMFSKKDTCHTPQGTSISHKSGKGESSSNGPWEGTCHVSSPVGIFLSVLCMYDLINI